MKIYLFYKYQKKNIVRILYLLTILLFVFRTSIPFFKYPFVFFYIISIITAFNYSKADIIKSFFNKYYLLYIPLIILVFEFILSSKFHLFVFKDIINYTILLSFTLLLTLINTKKNHIIFTFKVLLELIFYFAIIISVLALLDYLDIFTYSNGLLSNETTPGEPYIDNNFITIPSFMGFICTIYKLKSKPSNKVKILYNILLVLFTLHIFLSGSRRGTLLLIALLVIILVIRLFNLLSKKQLFKNYGINTILFYLITVIICCLFYLFIQNTTISQKDKLLKNIGAENLYKVKTRITNSIYKNKELFSIQGSFTELHNNIWFSNIDPKNPQSWHDLKSDKVDTTLTGLSSFDVPKGTIGYFLDSTCKGRYFIETNHFESFTTIQQLNINKNKKFKISIYCFVSNEFNGTIVRICLDYKSINRKIINGVTNSYYNLKNKGKWQKLELEFDGQKIGTSKLYLTLSKYHSKNFANLKGHAIFANPVIEIIDKVTQTDSVIQNSDYVPTISLENILPDELDYEYFKNIKINSAILSLPYFMCQINHIITDSINRNLFRKWVSSVLEKDTTFYPYKSNLSIDIKKEFGEDRLSRWKFAIEIFSKEYNWIEKIFGGGFDFLNWYGYVFKKDKTAIDYPHNPFVHILLYSGIVGLLIYIFLLYKVFKYYIKYRKEYPLLFIFFLIIYYFSFFSAGHPFDPPMLGFFIILPFFIHSIHEKEEKKNLKRRL